MGAGRGAPIGVSPNAGQLNQACTNPVNNATP